MWGRQLVARYPDVLEFVGLCYLNPLRVDAARKAIGVTCPTFTNLDEMLDKVKPELLTVTTVDGTHSEIMIKALERGIAARKSIDENRAVKIADLVRFS